MLSAYRVLDLSDQRGQLAGQILADLGAEVILVEPPGGSPARAEGPFVAGHEGDPARSLWFWAYNRGKRSVVLDIRSSAGRDEVRRLARHADLAIESAAPGAMAAIGLGPEDLARENPALVYTSITPFGQTGPKAGWAATDLTVVAAGVQLGMMGDEDRPPVRIPLDQAFLHAAADAAVGSLVALRERSRSGRGQHVDVSAQASVLQATQSFALSHLYRASPVTRTAGGTKVGPFHVRLRSPAADGHVSTTILFGEAIGPFSKRLFDWIHAEGECDDGELEIDWLNFVEGVVTGRIPASEYDRIQDVAAAFTSRRSKADLLREALARRLLIVPIATVADVVESEQYAARNYWRSIDVPELGRAVRFPGPFAVLSATPLDTGRPAPALGADDPAALATAPSAALASATRERAARAEADGDARPLPFDGLKVLDFMWVMAGPAGTRVLADYGAQVVRVESANKIETARTIQPFLDDQGGAENSGLYQNMNAGKLGLTLDLSRPEAREVVLDLVRWADVVCESFSPKAMRAWGLGYEDLRKVKPDLIMASSCLFGQTGPLSSLAGYGTMGASLSGFYDMTGWPDREPAGCFGAYTDYISPRFLAAAIVAALDHRERTGEGQYIDVAQAEASIAFLAPAVLDYEVNGRLAPRPGNRHPVMVPHGVFPAAGDDRWIAIACQGDEAWRALAGAARLDPALAGLDADGRRAREDELEAAIAAWTAPQDAAALTEALQAIGVAAHAVQSAAEAAADPQLAHRGHFVEAEHADHGTVWVENSRFGLSRTPAAVTRGGPTLGQHTFDVLVGILGYDDDRLAELAVAGVLE
ncbi:MAG: CoA transferase [Acidimicrobiales bacterium]